MNWTEILLLNLSKGTFQRLYLFSISKSCQEESQGTLQCLLLQHLTVLSQIIFKLWSDCPLALINICSRHFNEVELKCFTKTFQRHFKETISVWFFKHLSTTVQRYSLMAASPDKPLTQQLLTWCLTIHWHLSISAQKITMMISMEPKFHF